MKHSCLLPDQNCAEPFAFGDFTWVQGNNRQKSALVAGKYFTGGITLDCNYNYAFNKPIDHTNSGSTATFRSNEFNISLQRGIKKMKFGNSKNLCLKIVKFSSPFL